MAIERPLGTRAIARNGAQNPGLPLALPDSKAGDGLEDAVDLLNLVDDDRPDTCHVGGFDLSNNVILSGDRICMLDAGNALERPRDLESLARRRIDENVRPHGNPPPADL